MTLNHWVESSSLSGVTSCKRFLNRVLRHCRKTLFSFRGGEWCTWSLPGTTTARKEFTFIPNYAIDCSAFTINNGCANVRQWLRQAYSPPNGDIAFSPTLRFRSALGWIISPFQGCFSMVNCQWLFVGYMIRRVPRITMNHCPKGLKARIISAPSRKGGVSTSGPCSEGWRPELNSFLFLLLRNLGLFRHLIASFVRRNHFFYLSLRRN